MSMMTKFLFQRNFNNADFMTKNNASKNGVASTEFAKADTDGDNKISIEEILANDEVCDRLMTQINQMKTEMFNVDGARAKVQAIGQEIAGDIKEKVEGKEPPEKKDDVPPSDNFGFERFVKEKFGKDFKTLFGDNDVAQQGLAKNLIMKGEFAQALRLSA